MATVEEVLAKAKEWEAAGNPANAAKLRAYAQTLQPTQRDAASVLSKADEWETAGQPDKAAKLRAYAETLAPAAPAAPATDTPVNADRAAPPPPSLNADVQTPPRALSESEVGSNLATEFAGFEMFNPELKGRYTPETMPKAGEVVMGVGGGGKSGGARLTVRPWRRRAQELAVDEFGDTAKDMIEGPLAAMSAYGGGLTGGPSPSRAFFAKDPQVGQLPGPVLTGLGAVGDAVMAPLSFIGAGLSGAIGLGAELVPGQDAESERSFSDDVQGMAMFAVPELAGASSIAARAASAAPKVAPVAKAVEAAAPVAKAVEAAAPVAKAVAETPEAVAALVRKASKPGMGSVKAQEKLAEAARLNPEAKAAADRLGIELPADVFSDNDMVKAAAGLTRSEVGKEPEAFWRGAIKNARDKADEVMAAMDGSPDIASVSEAVKSSLQATRDGLQTAANGLYKLVDDAVPKSSEVPVQNIVKALNGVIEDIGGATGLSAAERGLYNLVTGSDKVTYGRLKREKADIGRAIARGDGPYGNMDQATLKRMYGAISEDQLGAVEALGSPELRAQLREANQLTAKQKGLEKRIVNAFGNDLDGSIGAKLRGAINQGSKGDIAGLNRIIKVIPQDLRKQAVASALAGATRSARATEPGFGLSEFAKVFEGIRTNKPVYNQIGSAIGPEGMAMLDDLLTVTKRITSADSNVLRTGKANQVLANAMSVEGVIGRVLHSTGGQKVVQAGSVGVGTLVGGPLGGMVAAPIGVALSAGKAESLLLAGKLFNSPEFMAMAVEAVQKGILSAAAIQKVERSARFKAWAKSAQIKNPGDILKNSAAPIGQAAATEAANTNRNPDYEALRGRY